jgi:hypothetical protein
MNVMRIASQKQDMSEHRFDKFFFDEDNAKSMPDAMTL